MSPRARRRIGWGMAGLVVVLLAASALDKLSGSEHSLAMTSSFGIDPTTYRCLGVIELVSTALFLVPGTTVLGLLLLASYLGGAIATHLQHGQSMVLPAAIEAWVWATAFVRMPTLFARRERDS